MLNRGRSWLISFVRLTRQTCPEAALSLHGDLRNQYFTSVYKSTKSYLLVVQLHPSLSQADQ